MVFLGIGPLVHLGFLFFHFFQSVGYVVGVELLKFLHHLFGFLDSFFSLPIALVVVG